MDRSEYTEIIELSKLINKIENLEMLDEVYNQLNDYEHPQIFYDFGMSYFVLGNKERAKWFLKQGAEFGGTFNPTFYDDFFSNAVGQCFAVLLQEYRFHDFRLGIKATALAYAYLSKCIELYNREVQDSYRTRGMLFEQYRDPTVVVYFIINNVGIGKNSEPYIIADYFFASQATGSPYPDLLNSARKIHEGLGDMMIGGKEANQYTLREMSEFGEGRHLQLFKTIEPKFKRGEFHLTATEFNYLFQ